MKASFSQGAAALVAAGGALAALTSLWLRFDREPLAFVLPLVLLVGFAVLVNLLLRLTATRARRALVADGEDRTVFTARSFLTSGDMGVKDLADRRTRLSDEKVDFSYVVSVDSARVSVHSGEDRPKVVYDLPLELIERADAVYVNAGPFIPALRLTWRHEGEVVESDFLLLGPTWTFTWAPSYEETLALADEIERRLDSSRRTRRTDR